ncbi:MAG: late competence development ComFB family protein [Oscillospiraceae bacterium]|nr:late competence development ComFB family protein [Oscillospiraceae bacterium]
MPPRRSGKKDFDLERMYQKLVPSMGDELPGEPEVIPEPEPFVVPDQEENPFEPLNLMECILLEKMDHTMKMLRSCDCQRCRGDILAIALNQLPCAYVVDCARVAEKVSEMRRLHEVKVTSALIMAVQTVKANPRH